jgi:hypothetical protein
MTNTIHDEQLAESGTDAARLNHAGVGINGKVYCIGGCVEQNHSAVSDVSVYDPVIDKWRQLMPLPFPLGSVSVAALEGKIHVVGGASAFIVFTIEQRITGANWSATAQSQRPHGSGPPESGYKIPVVIPKTPQNNSFFARPGSFFRRTRTRCRRTLGGSAASLT